MDYPRARYLVPLLGLFALLLCASPTWGLTAQEIADSVIDELDNVSTYQASADVEFDQGNYDDQSDATMKWKRCSGNWKFKMVMGSPWNGEVRTDGVNGYNIWHKDNILYHLSMSEGDRWVRGAGAPDLFNMERCLDEETWTKAESTETVNSVECYKLYNDEYEVWIDTATVKKVIRVKVYDTSSRVDWQLGYSNYSNVESTAQLPATIVVKAYDDNENLEETATWTFSNIDINETIADSQFGIDKP